MKFSKILLVILTSFISLSVFGQNGFIRGTVIDEEFGESMIGVTVLVAGTTTGSVTDFDGKFNISIAPGTYKLQVSFVSYETITISDVEVVAGQTVVFDAVRMAEAVEELEAVVVTAEVIKTSEAALLTVKKKSANLMDGISSASFKKIGDSNAAGAVKRVTGVSVEGGKYVYVRGLGDRYTKTMLNSMDIPGLDPDRNSLQIDIFPTNLLNNMVIVKSATANLPADFTGGLVNIETKDFPEEKVFDVSFGVTYNPSMHFKNDALTYEGSSTDWLGFDTNLRELPAIANNRDLPLVFFDDDSDVLATSQSFSSTLAATEQTNFMDYSLGLSYGNQKNFENGNTLGYIFSSTYKRGYEFYQNVFYGEYQRQNEVNAFDFGMASTRQGAFATETVLLGGLGGLAFKTPNSKYRLSLMHLQNGEKKAASLDIVSDDVNDDFDPRLISDYVAVSNNLEYGQRGLTNIFLGGEHHIKNDKWVIDWRFSPTFSSLVDPDIRRAAFSTDAGVNQINAGAAGSPSRIWRFLDETNYVGKVDVTKEAMAFGQEAKLKFGTSLVAKNRSYSIQQFVATQFGTTFWDDDASFDDIVSEENLFPNGQRIYYNRDIAVPNPNAYESSNRNFAGYVSAELSFTEKLKTIVGLRVENFEQKHSGRDQTAARTISNGLQQGITQEQLIQNIKSDPNLGFVLEEDVVLSSTDLFPSVNAIYSLSENQNLRFSYAKTIARPSFKELSYAQILDPLSNRTFNGGFFAYVDEKGQSTWDGNLRQTNINNMDVRWEFFPTPGQLFSVSAFYKTFDAPIELVRITSSQTGNEFQPRNVGNGQVLGAEIEVRKKLDFLGTAFDKLSTYGNITVVDSEIDMTEIEFQSRLIYEKEGQSIQNTRAMAGQAPYVVNYGLQYDDQERAIDAGLFYNVKGRTLIVVGEGFFPDIYSQPFHSLNFNFNKSIGPERKTVVSLKVSNILNDVREEFFSGFNASDEIFTRLTPGTEIGVGLKYSF